VQTLSPSEVLTYTTVRLECRSGSGRTSVGTAFYFSFLQNGQSSIPTLVTNKHVISGSATGTFFLRSADNTAVPKRGLKIPVTMDDFQNHWIPHPGTEVDLCIMPLAPLLTEAKNKGIEPFYVPLDISLIPSDTELAELTALEDIIMIGYPIGIWDSHNNMPVIRRGITATHPAIDYENRKEFMIDSACFPGSSGSPVYLFNTGTYASRDGGTVIGNRTKLLGILYGGPQFTAEGEIQIVNVPTHHKAVAMSRIPTNLGVCIKSARLLEFEPILRTLLAAQS
jgi:hypothetical protein